MRFQPAWAALLTLVVALMIGVNSLKYILHVFGLDELPLRPLVPSPSSRRRRGLGCDLRFRPQPANGRPLAGIGFEQLKPLVKVSSGDE
jgi:hypothetical protein